MKKVLVHRSLLVRLVATSVLIAVCSIATTAWLAVQTTTKAIAQAQDGVLADDARIYDALVGYAATHPSWSGVDAVVRDLAVGSGRTIVLTGQDRTPIAGTGDRRPLPASVSAVVNPLQVDPTMQPGTTDGVDARAVGPYLLPAAERDMLQQQAVELRDCVVHQGYLAQIVVLPTGRSVVTAGDSGSMARTVLDKCRGSNFVTSITVTERTALDELAPLVTECLHQRGLPGVQLTGATSWSPGQGADRRVLDADMLQRMGECVDIGRRQQLSRYVAPPALLFIRGSAGSAGGGRAASFNLSRANLVRIGWVTGGVLAVTVLVTVLFAVRLVRPLRALTAAASSPTGQEVRVPVRSRDEIGVLAEAFNDLAERRRLAEAQRKAMVSDVAHELRTPLSNIRSWLEAVEDGLADPTSDPVLTGALLREALQLQHIVDDLQDLAAADAGGLRLDFGRVRLADLLDQVMTAHESVADAAGVTLRLRSPRRAQPAPGAAGDGPAGPDLVADAVRLRQAVGNLVSNAVRHTPPGGSVTVYVGHDGAQVEITVVDTGEGIEPDDLPHVFDRFWRADRSRSRSTGGSGLGLAIVRQIVEAHGGEVTAASTRGQGATFTLRLPVQPRRSGRRW